MALIFLLGWPLEWVPIVLIIVPILIPLLDKMDVNLTWFGILVAVNLQDRVVVATGGAVGLFPERGGSGVGSQGHLHRHDAVFMAIQLIGLAAVLVFPQLALWLPSLIYG